MAQFGTGLVLWLTASISVAAGALACGTGDVSIPDSAGIPNDMTSPTPGSKSTTGPTFHKDVQPILEAHCQKCHTTGGLAPFALLTYADAKVMAPAMVAETAAKRMPPWG